MGSINIIFPHQLFQESPLHSNRNPCYLIEEWLFFKQFNFHKQKLAYHRASMKFYEHYLKGLGLEVHYVASNEAPADIREFIASLKDKTIKDIHFIDPADNWLQKRLQEACEEHAIATHEYPSPSFLNSKEALGTYFKKGRKRYHQTQFYTEQRKTRRILLQDNGKPVGDKWTFDTENRKKYPAKKTPPSVQYPDQNTFYEEAVLYVEKNFSNNLGTLEKHPTYPNTFETADAWFQQFLEFRFAEFGPYEDAIVSKELILNHSVLTPMLNTGLLTPKRIIDEALAFAENAETPLNSLEGFIRQLIGWREFIHGIYEFHGSEERTKNFWGFTKKIPPSFYDGTTGITPLDDTIKKVLKTGYCHHIERLMVLGNFMMLCEFDPDEVYRWFMELFIDAYDWVMVPNIYGMSQFSDGGLFATKPYISGSNYLMKMSDYKKGEWQAIWDGLFWRFMDVHREFFLKNPRLGMLVRTFDKMNPEKKEQHLKNAEAFLSSL